MWGIEERDYQTKTYSKYPKASRMVETTTCGSEKEISQQPKKQSCYVWNKCSHKTRGGCPACKWNESTDSDENPHRSSYWKTLQRPKHQSLQQAKRQAKPDRKSSGTLTFEVNSVTGPLQTTPKRKTTGTQYKMGGWVVGNRFSSRMRTILRKDRFELMEMKTSILPNWENTDEHQNEKPGSTFKIPSRTKSPIQINKHCNAQE